MYFANTNVSSGKGKASPEFAPNQRIPEGHFSDSEVKRLLACGAIRHLERAAVTEAPERPEENVDPLVKGRWSFQAADLADLTLDELNMLVAQHIEQHGLADAAPFDDVEEAIAFMTQDHEPEDGDQE